MNGICSILDRHYGAIPSDDCNTEWLAVSVDRAGNQTEIGRYNTEDEAEEAAGIAHKSDLADHGQFGMGA